MKKYVLLLICLLCAIGHLRAQSSKLSRQDKRRIKVVKEFCRYVQKTPPEEINQELLFDKYLSFEHILSDTTADSVAHRVFHKLLTNVALVLDTTDIKSYQVVPWNKYTYPNKLPKMLWEKEPLSHIWGRPLPNTGISQQDRVKKGQKQLEDIMVCFKKEKPEEPLYYFLFDDSNQIASWLLVRQGGLHYFLTF